MDSVKLISAQEFDRWQPALKVIIHDHPRKFASLKLADAADEVALSWRSELVEPVVLHDGLALVWVGVDQRVICITRQGVTLFSVGLGSSLLDIKRFPEFVAVLCDVEVLTVNLDYSIRCIYSLGDVPSMFELVDGELVVTFVDGATKTLCSPGR